MSWKRIFVGSQIEYAKQERPGSPGRSVFLTRRAHLLTTRYAGGGMAFGHRALSEGDYAFCGKRPPMPSGIDGATGEAIPMPSLVACENLPLAAFRSLRGTRDGRRKTEVIETGNLSFGGKGYQPRDGPLRCRGSGLSELLPDLQRLRWSAA